MRGLNRPPEEGKLLAYRLLQAQRQPEFQDVPEPHAGPGQVVVRVAGSDWRLWAGHCLMDRCRGATGPLLGAQYRRCALP